MAHARALSDLSQFDGFSASFGLQSPRMICKLLLLLGLLQLLGLGQAAWPGCDVVEEQQQQQQRQIAIGIPAACSLTFAASGAAAAAPSNASLQRQQQPAVVVVQGVQNTRLGRPVAVELRQAAAGQDSAPGVVLLAPGVLSFRIPSLSLISMDAVVAHACIPTQVVHRLLRCGPGR
jgi:hypothetical protein